MITNGANSSINVMCQTVLRDGDEMIVIEPFFPQYLAHIQLGGAKIKTVPLVLVGHEFKLDLDSLKAALNEKTRLIILNTPHNPTGKVFSRAELLEITEILEGFPHVFVISDEVYDFLTFDDHEHVMFANLKNNWEKTITVFSGGKQFSCTGWKIGWSIAPADIIR